MTSKERVLTALRHEKPDIIPFSSGSVNEYARKQLAKYLSCNVKEIERKLYNISDLRWVSPLYIGPQTYIGAEQWPQECTNKPNIWGVKHKSMFNGFDHYSEISYYPLAGLGETKSIEDHVFPSPDWFNYDSLKEIINKENRDGEYAIVMGNGNIFETSWYMTGFENMLTLILTEPDLAYRLLEKVTDFYVTFFERALDTVNGSIDIIFTADDIGQQDGLLMSLTMWEKMLKPHHARLNKLLHKSGAKIMYHTDGAVMDAMDGLVDMGIDIFQAIQFDAKGMDPVILKTKWGDKISFCGGVSVQSTLPFGSIDDVRMEVQERISVLGKNGGYILSPSHAIQGGTPPENIVAFFEEAGRPLVI